MAERVYNKLVRDNIPDFIREDGETPILRVLDDGEYLDCLKEKLREETAEFLQENTMEEFADMMEVLVAIAEAMSWPEEELRRIRRDKAERNGAFRERIFLEKVVSNGGVL